MPLVEIFTTRRRDAGQKQALLQFTRTALARTFLVPERDVTVWLREFSRGDALCPPEEEDGFTAFLVHCFSGRSAAQKRRLYACLFQKLREAGETTGAFQLTIEESPLDNWGLDGGVSAAEFLTDQQQ